jgi:ElaB/YqjD/DUF883 family membrane-anchored ribosome-binding protein
MGQVPDDLKEITAVESEVDTLRERTQQLVAELERRLRARATQAKQTFERARRAVDVRAQIKAHPGIAIGVSAAAATALGIGVYVAVTRALEQRRPMNRLRARAQAYRALLADPRRALRKREPFGKRLLAALLIAGATTIVRGLSLVLVKRTIEPRMLPPPRAETNPPT